jgi:hypothetical protein
MANIEPKGLRPMFKRTALLALVASAVVGFATLVSSSADARPHGGSGASPHRVVGGGNHGMIRNPGMIRPVHNHGRHLPHIGRHIHLRNRLTIVRPGCWRHPWLCRPIVRPHLCWSHPWMCRRPVHIVRYGGYYPVAAATLAPAPVAASCTCLRKTYLPNGAVLFQDVCTNESAVNPPAQAAEAPAQ